MNNFKKTFTYKCVTSVRDYFADWDHISLSLLIVWLGFVGATGVAVAIDQLEQHYHKRDHLNLPVLQFDKLPKEELKLHLCPPPNVCPKEPEDSEENIQDLYPKQTTETFGSIELEQTVFFRFLRPLCENKSCQVLFSQDDEIALKIQTKGDHT